MKYENINAMLYYIEKSGISTENITGAHYRDDRIILKRESVNKTTSTINVIEANIDIKSDMVVIKDENTYEYISLNNNDNSYIFNLQTLIVYRVLNKKLNVYMMSVSQKVKDKKDIVKFDSISDFDDKEKNKLLNKKSNKIISEEVSYDIPDNYKIVKGIPESDKVKVLK